MGYALTQFACTVDENLLCGVCGGVLEDAVLTSCGHSFCSACLHTWLERQIATCPECRCELGSTNLHPIICVRNFILSLPVTCPNAERGCTATVQLERVTSHVKTECEFAVTPSDSTQNETLDQTPPRDVITSQLTTRAASFDAQLGAIQSDLDAVLMTNSKLERDLQKARDGLERKCTATPDAIDAETVYSCAYSADGVHDVTSLISSNLMSKPASIASDRLFNALVTCYRNFAQSSSRTRRDVFLLLTVACASNWFTQKQRTTLSDLVHESF